MKRKQTLYIIVSVCLLATAMNFVDAVLTPPYFVKSLIKAALFLLAPLFYFYMNREEVPELKRLLVPCKKDMLRAAALGLICYGGIVGGYFLLRGVFDFSNITASLTGTAGVSPDNFLYVALYISFCNSFLEEFFFRGFAFITLKRHTGRTFAYWFSSGFFAFYHVGMTLGWVQPLLFALGFGGLVAGGFIFNWLNEKTGSLYPSWLVHMFINFGINTIGFILFGML